MPKEFNRQNPPIYSKDSQTALVNFIGTEEYIKYCASSHAIQSYWRSPEHIAWPINETTQEPVPVLTSNINPGDFFNLGSSRIQVCIVTKKITNVQSGIAPENRQPSIHPNGDYFTYVIDGDRGGFSPFNHPHEEMTDGFLVWLPIPLQLLAIGLVKEYQDLTAIIESRIHALKGEEDDELSAPTSTTTIGELFRMAKKYGAGNAQFISTDENENPLQAVIVTVDPQTTKGFLDAIEAINKG